MKATRFTFVFCLIFLLFSCKKEHKSISQTDVSEYITSYTRGVIQEDDQFVFSFKNDIPIIEKNIEASITIDPSVDYKASYNKFNNSIIIEADKVKRDQEYAVKLNLDKLIGKGGSFTSNVVIQGQYVNVTQKGLSIDKNMQQSLELEIVTAFKEDTDKLKEMFNIEGSKITVKKIDATHYLANIDCSGKDNLNIKWNAKNLGSKSNGVVKYSAKNLRSFKVLSTFHDKKNNTVTAYFSQKVKKKQDLAGHIKVGNKNPRYTIDDNKIIVKIGAINQVSTDVTFKKGIISTTGKKTRNDHVYGISLEMTKPELVWLDDGKYIPASGKFKIPFKAKGLKAVKIAVAKIPSQTANQYMAWNGVSNNDQQEMVRYGDFVIEKDIDLTEYASNLNSWNEFGIDIADNFKREPGAIYKIYLSFNPSQTTLVCDNPDLEDYEVETLSKKWFDRTSRYYSYYYSYNYSERDNQCSLSYYAYLEPLTKSVLCTNVFPIIKKGGENVTVAIKELESNNLASGAKVTLLDLQGKAIATQSTSGGGITNFTNIDRNTAAVKIVYNGFTSYFDTKNGSQNSFTEFDISSNVSSSDTKLFVYSDRDVRRPGDTVFVNVMLNDVDFDFPEGLPVMLKLVNPQNVTVNNQRQTIEKDKLIYTFSIPTSLDAPTGYWNAKINVGPTTTNYQVRIETIKPNVVETNYTFKKSEKNWINNTKITGSVNVNYLAGFPMKNGTITANANIRPLKKAFDDYPEYNFAPLETETKKDVRLFKGKTNNQGKHTIDSDFDFEEINAVSRITLDTKIDLPGGGNNTMTSTFYVSPLSSYVGIKQVRGRGWRGSFNYGDTPNIPLIKVNQFGKPTTGKAKVKIYKAKNDWWYDRYRMSENYAVETSSYFEKIATKDVSFSRNGKALFTHNNSFGSGLFVIVVEDSESGHIAEYKYHAVMTEDYSVESNPIFIQLELEKHNYDVDETLKVKLPKIKNAKALVSIEKGDQIIESFWMDINTPQLDVKVKDNYYPNFYLNVSIVQEYGNKENDRPMRMYTVEKIKVNERSQKLNPEITAPEKVRPNESFTFKVEEKNGQPMEYTVAVVDRGLLSLTGFQTPDPLAHFSKQFPLLVKTWDIFDDLIYYLDPSYSGVFSIGGDGTNKKLDEAAGFNRFEPVVYHLGPYKIGKHGSKKHTIDLPNYIGSLKVMVVAVNKETFGNNSTIIKVASPLMVQSQLPRALNVSDKITLPVTLFKDEQSIKNANILASSDNKAVSFENNDISVNLSTEDQAFGELKLKVNEIAGKTTIGIKAQSGKFKSNEATNIFVNYPNGYSDKTTYLEILPNESKSLDISAFGYPNTQNVTISLSGAILPDFSKYYTSLIAYPHGCLEQTTSKGFCLLFTEGLIQLTPKEQAKTEEYLSSVMDKYASFQKSDGAFKYWEDGYYHDWANLYAGHFLLESIENEIEVNRQMVQKWLEHTKSRAEEWEVNGTSKWTKRNEEIKQAYRLFLLAKANAPAKSAMNRFRKRDLTPLAKSLLGGAYYYSGMQDIGQNLLADGISTMDNNQYDYTTFGTNIRNQCINLMLLSIMRKDESVDRYYKELVQTLNNETWLSTQEKGWALMACKYYFKDDNAKGNQKIEYNISSIKHNETKTLENNTYQNYHWASHDMGQQVTVKNTGEGKLFIVRNERAISNDLYPASVKNGVALSVRYTDLDGNAVSLSNIKQGQELMITAEVQNTDITDYKSLALSVKMPSGWELQNPRLLGTTALKNDNFQYQDYRDDKVYTYFGLDTNKSKTFRFRAIANLKGDFYKPAVSVEHMYLGNVRANTAAERVVVD